MTFSLIRRAVHTKEQGATEKICGKKHEKTITCNGAQNTAAREDNDSSWIKQDHAKAKTKGIESKDNI